MSEPRTKKATNTNAEVNTESGRLTGFRPQAGQLERVMAERSRRNGPLMTYGGRDFTGQGPYDL